MNDGRQGINFISIQHDIQLDHVGRFEPNKMVVEWGIALGDGLEPIEKVKNNIKSNIKYEFEEELDKEEEDSESDSDSDEEDKLEEDIEEAIAEVIGQAIGTVTHNEQKNSNWRKRRGITPRSGWSRWSWCCTWPALSTLIILGCKAGETRPRAST